MGHILHQGTYSSKGSDEVVYNNYNVYLDFTNEVDFELEEDFPVVSSEGSPLPGFPFHMHLCHYLKQVLSIVGIHLLPMLRLKAGHNQGWPK